MINPVSNSLNGTSSASSIIFANVASGSRLNNVALNAGDTVSFFGYGKDFVAFNLWIATKYSRSFVPEPGRLALLALGSVRRPRVPTYCRDFQNC